LRMTSASCVASAHVANAPACAPNTNLAMAMRTRRD